MELKDAVQNIGKTAIVKLEDIPVEVSITMARQVFGRVDYEITLNGISKYVDSSRVKVID